MPDPSTHWHSVRGLTVRVLRVDLHWEVRAPGRPRGMIDSLCTKERAIEHALSVAEELAKTERNRRIVVLVERADGSIEEEHAPYARTG